MKARVKNKFWEIDDSVVDFCMRTLQGKMIDVKKHICPNRIGSKCSKQYESEHDDIPGFKLYWRAAWLTLCDYANEEEI
jgi:hypothetical protein